LNRLPSELIRLPSLQSLILSECKQLSGDLSPLARLTSLQSLNLAICEQLSGEPGPRRLTLPRSNCSISGNVIQEAPLPVWAHFSQRMLDTAIAEINKKNGPEK
jgi:hypothetical protein